MLKYIKLLYSLVISLIIGIIIFLILNLKFVLASEIKKSNENNLDMIPLYLVVGIVGGCIAITLLYVSWRKYKGEHKKTQKKI